LCNRQRRSAFICLSIRPFGCLLVIGFAGLSVAACMFGSLVQRIVFVVSSLCACACAHVCAFTRCLQFCTFMRVLVWVFVRVCALVHVGVFACLHLAIFVHVCACARACFLCVGQFVFAHPCSCLRARLSVRVFTLLIAPILRAPVRLCVRAFVCLS